MSSLQILLTSICDTVYTTDLLSMKSLISSLDALDTQHELFRSNLQAANLGTIVYVKPNELQVLYSARTRKYSHGTPEDAFYKYGGDQGIMVLLLYFRRSFALNHQWARIHEHLQPWLVQRVLGMVDQEFITQITGIAIEKVAHLKPFDNLHYPGDQNGRKTVQSSLPMQPPIEFLEHDPVRDILLSRSRILFPPSSSNNNLIMFPETMPTPLVLGPPTRTQHLKPLSTEMAFQDLDSDIQDLACFLGYLGEAEVPKMMLLRSAEERKIYRTLEIHTVNIAPALNLNPLFASPSELDSALKHLGNLSLVRFEDSLGGPDIFTRSDLRQLVHKKFGVASTAMKVNIFKLVFHSIPTDANIRDDGRVLAASIVPWVNSILPHVQHVLGYLSNPSFIQHFSFQQREQISLSCLLLSGFSDRLWKSTALETAEMVLEHYKPNAELFAQLQMRRVILNRLGPTGLLSCNISRHVYEESCLFQVQCLIYKDELSQAWQELASWDGEDWTRRFMLQKQLLQIKICRFAGSFHKAKELLQDLLQKLSRDVSIKIRSHCLWHYVSIYCELNMITAAKELLNMHNSFVGEAWMCIGITARRISHLAATVHLMEGLWMLWYKEVDGLPHALECLQSAKFIFDDLDKVYRRVVNPGLVTSFHHFSVAIGLAMINHIEWRSGKITALEALTYWETAYELGEKSHRNLGGTPTLTAIVLCSICNLKKKLGLSSEAAELMDRAKALYTCRQFHIVGFGSIWLDLIQRFNAELGCPRLSVHNSHDYTEEQSNDGFPLKKGSTRLSE